MLCKGFRILFRKSVKNFKHGLVSHEFWKNHSGKRIEDGLRGKAEKQWDTLKVMSLFPTELNQERSLGIGWREWIWKITSVRWLIGHDYEVILVLSQSILFRVTLSDVILWNCVQEEDIEASSERPAIVFWQYSLELERIVSSSLLHLWCLCGSG